MGPTKPIQIQIQNFEVDTRLQEKVNRRCRTFCTGLIWIFRAIALLHHQQKPKLFTSLDYTDSPTPDTACLTSSHLSSQCSRLSLSRFHQSSNTLI